ncbi:MAG: Hsp20/alpha crystallin family protein [Methanosarcinales archaeon]|nr:Hsp20/alpha crystallin family protein [Methanosarcinales archaeon]
MTDREKRNIMDDIFKEMTEMIEDLIESGFNPDTQGTDKPLVWGISMAQRGNEPPRIREFGNMNMNMKEFMESMGEHQPDIRIEPGAKKPMVDILQADDTLHVIIEMPGINKQDITIDLVGDILNIKALSDDRKYSEQIELPAKVLPDPIKATYKNGVLEVIFVYDQSNRKSIKIE